MKNTTIINIKVVFYSRRFKKMEALNIISKYIKTRIKIIDLSCTKSYNIIYLKANI